MEAVLSCEGDVGVTEFDVGGVEESSGREEGGGGGGRLPASHLMVSSHSSQAMVRPLCSPLGSASHQKQRFCSKTVQCTAVSCDTVPDIRTTLVFTSSFEHICRFLK